MEIDWKFTAQNCDMIFYIKGNIFNTSWDEEVFFALSTVALLGDELNER